MVDADGDLADRDNLFARRECVVTGDDAAGERVLDGEESGCHVPALDRSGDVNAFSHRHRYGVGPQPNDCLFAVRARSALVGYAVHVTASRAHAVSRSKYSRHFKTESRACAQFRGSDRLERQRSARVRVEHLTRFLRADAAGRPA